MEIYLIRHTKTIASEGVCYGHFDVDLRQDYVSDADIIQNKLPVLDIIYSSPLKRCELLSKYLHANEIKYDSRLKELNFGNWEGKEWKTIDKAEMDLWMKNFVTERCPGGESYEDLIIRVKSFWEQLILTDTSKVALITHGGVIRTILGLILDILPEKAFTLNIDFGSISFIHYSSDHYIIKYINRI